MDIGLQGVPGWKNGNIISLEFIFVVYHVLGGNKLEEFSEFVHLERLKFV